MVSAGLVSVGEPSGLRSASGSSVARVPPGLSSCRRGRCRDGGRACGCPGRRPRRCRARRTARADGAVVVGGRRRPAAARRGRGRRRRGRARRRVAGSARRRRRRRVVPLVSDSVASSGPVQSGSARSRMPSPSSSARFEHWGRAWTWSRLPPSGMSIWTPPSPSRRASCRRPCRATTPRNGARLIMSRSLLLIPSCPETASLPGATPPGPRRRSLLSEAKATCSRLALQRGTGGATVPESTDVKRSVGHGSYALASAASMRALKAGSRTLRARWRRPTTASGIRARGEEAVGELAQALIENPLFNSALSRALGAGERAASAQRSAMGALNLPPAATSSGSSSACGRSRSGSRRSRTASTSSPTSSPRSAARRDAQAAIRAASGPPAHGHLSALAAASSRRPSAPRLRRASPSALAAAARAVRRPPGPRPRRPRGAQREDSGRLHVDASGPRSSQARRRPAAPPRRRGPC